MKVTCTQCQFSAEIPASYVGKTIECPKCGTHITVAVEESFTLVTDALPEGNHISKPASRGTTDNSQSATKTEENIDTLKLKAGTLNLTTRHLRGQMAFRTKVGSGIFAYETRQETLDVLLNNITGFVVTKAESAWILLVALSFLIAAGGILLAIILSSSPHSSDNEMAPAFLIGGGLATILGFIIPKSSEVIDLQIMGNSKIIKLSGGEEETRTKQFIESVMATKKAFESTL